MLVHFLKNFLELLSPSENIWILRLIPISVLSRLINGGLCITDLATLIRKQLSIESPSSLDNVELLLQLLLVFVGKSMTVFVIIIPNFSKCSIESAMRFFLRLFVVMGRTILGR